MFGLPLVASIVYIFAFFCGAASVAYGYFQWRWYGDKKELLWILLGICIFFDLAWGLFTRHLIISNTGNAPLLLWSRIALTFAVVVFWLILKWRQHVSRAKNKADEL
jgi:hypothetical protein